MAAERDDVHAALTDLFAPGGTLNETPGQLDAYLDDEAIVRTALAYMDIQKDVKAGGQAVIVSAGPPGAGKSRALGGLSVAGYRFIDPDIAKDMLLNETEQQGLLDYRHRNVLPDGLPVKLRELAAHVHSASTKVTDTVRRLALGAGENIIVDGTLSWTPLIDKYLDELFYAGYASLEVVNVEVPLHIALARAKERWWKGRQAEALLGGRFVPDDAIRACYDDQSDDSKCARNAHALATRAADELGHGTLRRFDLDPDGKPHQTMKVIIE